MAGKRSPRASAPLGAWPAPNVCASVEAADCSGRTLAPAPKVGRGVPTAPSGDVGSSSLRLRWRRREDTPPYHERPVACQNGACSKMRPMSLA